MSAVVTGYGWRAWPGYFQWSCLDSCCHFTNKRDVSTHKLLKTAYETLTTVPSVPMLLPPPLASEHSLPSLQRLETPGALFQALCPCLRHNMGIYPWVMGTHHFGKRVYPGLRVFSPTGIIGGYPGNTRHKRSNALPGSTTRRYYISGYLWLMGTIRRGAR